jgi:hypothetical protein
MPPPMLQAPVSAQAHRASQDAAAIVRDEIESAMTAVYDGERCLNQPRIIESERRRPSLGHFEALEQVHLQLIRVVIE